MTSLLKDIGYALRSLRDHPAFALTAIVTLALGIGSSTAIFSVVNAVLLRPLPYANSDRLALVWIDMRARGVRNFPFSPPGYKELREGTTSFSDVAGITPFKTGLIASNEHPEQVRAVGVTPNFLSMLGGRVILGRDFIESDAYAPPAPPAPPSGTVVAPPPPGAPTMVILGNAFWQRYFGGDAKVIGKSVDLGGGPATIVGVLAPGFQLLFPPSTNIEANPDVVTAQRINYETAPRLNAFLRLVARLKPGVTLDDANRDAERIAADARKQFTIIKTADAHYRVEKMSSDLVADVRPAILALMGAVVFVLLIACANVANLLLVRAAARERELTIRAALGGSRSRLVRQLLAESGVLGAAGAVVGLALSYASVRLLISLAPPNLPRLDKVGIDPVVLAFTTVAALVAAIIFGVVPAIGASRVDLAHALRASGRTPSLGGSKWLRNAVVTTEVALSFVLLVGGGLMMRSFIALAHTDPGFDPRGVLTFAAAARGGQSADQLQSFVTQLHTRLLAIPGVQSVTAASPLPLDGGIAAARLGTEEAANDPSKFQQANVHVVLPGYFATLRTPVLAGRVYTDDDNRPDFLGVVIDNLLAEKLFPGQNAVGKRLLVRARGADNEWLNVIGVVAHQRHASLSSAGREAMFFPDRYFGAGSVSRWAVRINCAPGKTCDPTTIASSVRQAVTDVDPLIPIAELQPMTAFVDRALAGTRFSLVLIAVFAGVAAVLACVGLYGVLSTAVKQRTAEIGVRMTYGATSRSIFGLVIGDGMKLSGVGLVIGLAAALALTRVMRSMLVGVGPTDAATYLAIVAIFLFITSLACWIPARRAASLDPAVALRSE